MIRDDRRTWRDAGLTALFEGFFGAAWFSWGASAAPKGVQPLLSVGAWLALVLAVVGAVIAVRHRAASAAMDNRAARRRYGIIVGIEFGAAGIGAVILGVTGHAAYTPVLVCAIVGIHFFPLAPVLRDRLLVPLGALLCAVALLALILRAANGTAPSTVSGIAAGTLLTVSAVVALVVRPTSAAPAAASGLALSPRGRQD